MEDRSLLVEGTEWVNHKTGEIGYIIDVQKKKGLVIFRFFKSDNIGSFTNMEFLREFESVPSHPKWVPKSDVNNKITVGSIWRCIRGEGVGEYNKGRLIKVVYINISLIGWRYLSNAEGCPDIEPGKCWTETLCDSSFLRCFEKVQDNDDGAIYQPFDRTRDAKEHPDKYQMTKVVGTNKSTNECGFVNCEIKWVTVPASSDVYSMNLEDFHSEFELISLNPAEEFCEDVNDPNHSRKLINSNEGERKMENSKETYLKTDISKLKDFGTGAKREDKTGKGRYDLIPGDVMSELEDFAWETYFNNGVTTCSATDVSKSAYFDDWTNVELYYDFIVNVISYFFAKDHIECTDDCGEISYEVNWDTFRSGLYEMRKQLALHYEAGAVVHGVDNWKKGLPVYGSARGGCFLDSMRRHIDQALMGLTDEPHAVAALWNAFCAVWTLENRPTSTMYQNDSAVKAEEKFGSTHFDMIDSAIDALKHMPENKNEVLDDKCCDINHEIFDDNFSKTSANTDSSKLIHEDDEIKKYDIMHQLCYVSYNIYKCIELLRSIVKNDKFSKLDPRVKTVYFNIYMIFKMIDRTLVLFRGDSEAIKQISKIITDFYIMINMKVGHIERCCGNIRIGWEVYPAEYLRSFDCDHNVPDDDEINILYEMIGRTGSVLLNSDGKGKLDYFRGIGITQSLLDFNTKYLHDRIYKNKK